MNWVEPLDRFDDVLKSFISRYGMDLGPQTKPFGSSLLYEGSPGLDEKRSKELGFGPEGDRELVESILDFSRLLVEKCANRAIYNSTDRLNDLLNTTSLSLLHVTLRLTIFLAQRFSERNAPSPLPITKFYDFDHDRLRRLASPIAQPQAHSRRTPTSPVKTNKGREKLPATRPRRASTVVNPNDFRSLCREPSVVNGSGKSAAAPEKEWQSLASVTVSWTTALPEGNSATVDGTAPAVSTPSAPASPTPLRRQPSSTTAGMEVTNGANTGTQPGGAGPSTVEKPTFQILDYTSAVLAKTTIEKVLSECPQDMPINAQYELLHKLRVAYGLMSSAKSRRDLLAVRILAINAVGNAFLEVELSKSLLGPEHGNQKPQELIQQLVNLIQDPKKGQASIPLYIQTLSMETLGVLARHKTFATDITAALGANSANGLLLRLTQRGLKDISTDDDATDNFEGDDWREAVFSMPRVVIEAAGHHGRTSESVISSSFTTAYVAGLGSTTGKAMRIHLRMLDFIKTFFHHFKDGLQVLLSTSTFEIVSNLLRGLTEDAWQQLQAGHGIPAEFKTRMTDYEIPYINQQIIRSIIDMINDISTHSGPNADRVLRGLIDSQALLVAVKLIMDHQKAFGAYTWGEVVKSLCNFLNNEPTSYTVISEAGIIKSFLSTITGEEPSATSANSGPKTLSSTSAGDKPPIPTSIECIINIAHLFEAICLTSAGFDLFKSSGALEKFFELFESGDHIDLIKDLETMRHLGQTFDELVRHHPNLRSDVISAVTVMAARTRWIGRMMAFELGAGPKLWLETGPDARRISGGPEAMHTEIVPPRRPGTENQRSRLKPISLPNGNTLSFDEEDTLMPDNPTPEDYDANGLSTLDYVKATVAFLSSFFRTQSLCSSFLEIGGGDIIIDLVTLPSTPVNEHSFAMPGFLDELSGVIHMMAEIKPQVIMPIIADRALYACNQLKHFAQCQPHNMQCYFGPLTLPSTGRSTTTDPASGADVEKNGTYLAKSLMAVHSLCQVLSEVFNAPIYGSRSTPNLFSQVNLADIFAELCRMLGTVSAACYREEIALQRAIRDPWLKATKPENFTTGYDDVDQILDVWESRPMPEINESSGSEPRSAEATAQESEQLKKDRDTAAFKNVKTLRYLLIETPAAITEFLNNIGHGIVSRRRTETFSKQKTALVADALAAAFVNQLQPYFLKEADGEPGLPKEARFAYLVIALTNVRSSLYDDIHTANPGDSCQTYVINAFKKAGGIQSLVKIGTEFFNELRQCKVEKSMFAANAGLKICLDILDELTSPKTITESQQASSFKNPDPSKPFYFVPAQVLLEIRMQALPLARLIWDSDYADQASKDVVQRLISIFKNILSGEYEGEAIQRDNEHPTIAPFTPRKFNIDPQKVTILKEKGFDEELAREALYRSNTIHNAGPTAAEEYCQALEADASRQRLPIPTSDTDVPATTRETPALSSPMPAQSVTPSGPVEAALAEVINNADDGDEMEDVTQSSIESVSEPAPAPQASTSSAMDISNILNKPDDTAEQESTTNVHPSHTRYSVESLDVQRGDIRDSLAERCNNILNTHPNLAFELSDLISSATRKLSHDEIKNFWEATSELLVMGLLSMQSDEEITESKGKKIAAAAHLTALLIQDTEVFRTTLNVFQENFEDLLSFLNVPANVSRKTEEPYPWVSPVLLIVERMLSQDSEPAQVTWAHPSDLESCPEAVLTHTTVVDTDQKKQLFTLLVDLLPRVAKDKGMALSISRVLVMLTRTREIALMLGEKRNLQRLFLMIKQLGYGTSGRLLGSFMMILRHIVEDDETIRQIMRSEITAAFAGRNAGRQLDATNYTRELYHLVLRSPPIFVEVTKEMLKLASWQPNSPGPGLTLKEESQDKSDSDTRNEEAEVPKPATGDPSDEAAKSVEIPEEGQTDAGKSKPTEIKPPVVEHPDGVIHFILSELLSYKDVEDREPSAPTNGPSTTDQSVDDGAGQGGPDFGDDLINAANGLVAASDRLRNAVTRQLSGSPDVSDDSSDLGAGSEAAAAAKTGKPKFKPEDHPIFIYRCFLLNCLVELLHSYNRTKVEFINFSRKSDPMAVTPSKPRSGILNYVLNGLVASGYVDKDEQSIHCKKRLAVSDWAIKVIVALCSKTGENGLSGPAARYSSTPQIDDTDDEPELTFVRRFVLEHAIRAFKDASSSTEALQAKYSKLLCLSDMFNRLLTKPSGPDGSAGVHNTSYKVLARMMFDKNLVSVLTSSLAEIDLSNSGAKRVVKFILRPLQDLTTTATQLSLTAPEAISSVLGNTSDDDISSASSVSEVEDEREETPDLYRNSALGMLDPTRARDSDSDGEDEDEDEEMYEEDEYGDEMDYDDGMPGGQEGDEAVSDDEDDRGHADGPIEGLPGDVPMELEFVVDETGMEVDTDDDDEEGDSDDDEEDDDDDEDDEEQEEDGEDFMIEGEDGEINADNENDSLGEGQEDEGDWEDEDGEDDDQEDEDQDGGHEVHFDHDDADNVDVGGPMPMDPELNNLLRVLGHGGDGFEGGGPGQLARELIVPPVQAIEPAGDNEDDENDDEEDMDENDEMDYGGFDDLMDGGDDLLDEGGWDYPRWDEAPTRRPAFFPRRQLATRAAVRSHPSGFLARRMGDHWRMTSDQFAPPMTTYTRMTGRRPGRPDADDGTNPLLQRPNPAARSSGPPDDVSSLRRGLPTGLEGLPGFAGMMPPMPMGGGTISTVIQGGDEVGGHGAMLDAIIHALHRGDRNFLRGGHRININMSGPLGEFREIIHPDISLTRHRHHHREDPPKVVNFTPATTTTRWQEEARLLFSSTYVEKVQRVQLLITSLLVPDAQKEEKERRQKQEEDRKAQRERDEEERKKAEAEAAEAERLRKEEEERAAAAHAEEARQRAEAEAAATAAAAETDASQEPPSEVTADEPMEDVQPTEGTEQPEGGESSAAATSTEEDAQAQPRVFTTIRGRQLDITGLAIDVEYLEALPEDLREEVIMQQYSTRREEAQQQSGDADAAGIDPAFLDALPEDIREEIRQQEAHAQRRRERDAARRQAATASAGQPQAGDMDNDDFLATLDPALRRAILAEQPVEILDQLAPRHAAEGREHARRLFHYTGIPVGRDAGGDRNDRLGQRDAKRQIVQLVDKAGVATLLRLMFLPQQGSLRSNLWHILRNVCGNRQTRFEVINMILVILKEGSTDVTAVERSLASLSLRAKATAAQKTPQPLKRTLSMQPHAGLSEEVTPLVVVQQCLSALKQLSQHGYHVRTIFLREVDVSSSSRKGKAKEAKTTKYPINDLISLLDRKLIMESSSCLQSLAELLAATTSALPALMRADKEKEKPEEAGKKPEEGTGAEEVSPEQPPQPPADASEEQAPPQASQDATMTEAPAASSEEVPAAAESSAEAQPTTTDEIKPVEAGKPAEVEESKAKKFEPPVIPERNLQLIVSIFVAPECGGDTFHSTLDTMKSIAHIPGTQEIFSRELISHVKNLSQSLCSDLDDFVPLVREASNSTDLHGTTSTKFSHSGSDQVKLLQVLKALDHLSAPKQDDETDENATSKSILTASYEGLSLGPLWGKLSECLSVMREKDNVIAFANILLPLIESLMVVCKNTSLKDAPLARQLREQAPTTPTVDDMDGLEKLFFNFTTEHRKILNDIIRQSPKLMQGNGSFSLLVKNPKVLDFDNKRAYFTKQIHSRLHQQRHVQPPLQLNVRRDQVFQDSYKALYFKSADEMKYGKLNIRFNGEEGVDAGGVTREWFQVLARGIFNPDWALWQPVASDRTTFHPNPLSWINGEHLVYFKFIGRIIGKALHEGRVLDCHFSRAVYKRMLGKQPNLKDLESMDLDYYKSLLWILENDITDIITEDFSVIEEQFGDEKIVDLIPDGRNVPVTEENKREYVQKLVEYRLTTSVTEQLEDFVKGFHDIIPAELVAIFDEQELELLISGLPEIDVDDWKANTEYHNYNANSPQVTWFWRIVRAMSNEERAKLLQFITGTSKVPLNGFKDLEGMQGTTRFSGKSNDYLRRFANANMIIVHRDPSHNRLPTSHTCFNQLDLPAYDNQEMLKTQLMTAINLGADYFGFA